jgi:hypothetical protein
MPKVITPMKINNDVQNAIEIWEYFSTKEVSE